MSRDEGAGRAPRSDPPLRNVFLTGLGWTAGSFGSLRLLSFAQTIVLARLLAPADFGAFAMASLSVSLAQVFSSLGLGQAVVQSRLDDRATLDTAFCVNLLRGALLYAVLFFVAPFVERFYATPGVALWTRVLALTVLIEAGVNVGMVLYTKQLDYRRAALYGQVPFLVATLSAPLFAIWIRSAWALVLSQILASAVQLPFSYWAHPYRPRLRVDRAALRHLVEYGRYVLGSGPLFYLSSHVDEMAIGRRFGSRAMGAYQLSYNVAALPATYLGELVSGVLFPVFARLQSRPAALREAYTKTVRHIAGVCLPISVAFLTFAPELIRLVYGKRWDEAIPTLQAFFLYGAIRPLGSLSLQVFRATGETRAILRLAIANLVGVGLMVIVGISYGPTCVALLLSALSIPVMLYAWDLTAKCLGLTLPIILRACAPVAAAAAVALAAVLASRPSLSLIEAVPLRLVAGLGVLAAVYLPALALFDRRWLAEIVDLVRGQWANMARDSRNVSP